MKMFCDPLLIPQTSDRVTGPSAPSRCQASEEGQQDGEAARDAHID